MKKWAGEVYAVRLLDALSPAVALTSARTTGVTCSNRRRRSLPAILFDVRLTDEPQR